MYGIGSNQGVCLGERFNPIAGFLTPRAATTVPDASKRGLPSERDNHEALFVPAMGD